MQEEATTTESSMRWRHAVIHSLPSVTGLVRLMVRQPVWTAKLLRARIAFFSSRVFPGPLKTPDGFVIESASELISYWSFFVEREGWTSELSDALRREDHPVVVDVGANAGVFTHWIWTHNRGVEFFDFEPLPKMAAKIRQWQTQTGARLTLHNAAVSDHCGTATFYAGADNDTGASLRQGDSNAMQLSVPLLTLDSVVPEKPILLTKIDVEGFEVEVLAGAKKTLANSRFVLIEAHTQEAFTKIRNQLASPTWNYQRVGSSDYLFIRA